MKAFIMEGIPKREQARFEITKSNFLLKISYHSSVVYTLHELWYKDKYEFVRIYTDIHLSSFVRLPVFFFCV